MCIAKCKHSCLGNLFEPLTRVRAEKFKPFVDTVLVSPVSGQRCFNLASAKPLLRVFGHAEGGSFRSEMLAAELSEIPAQARNTPFALSNALAKLGNSQVSIESPISEECPE